MRTEHHAHRFSAGLLRLLGTCTRGAAILAVAAIVACDAEPVVAPPAAAVAPDSESSESPSAAKASERDILIALYKATGGPNWVNGENWLTDARSAKRGEHSTSKTSLRSASLRARAGAGRDRDGRVVRVIPN